MPRAIIAGTAQALVTRNKLYQPAVDGWDIVLCHSRRFKSDLSTCWRDVLALADDLTHDGAHILAFHNPADQRPRFEADVYGSHRLIWLDQSYMAFYGTDEFSALMGSILEFEREWRDSIRPRDIRSALVLPESSFETKAPVGEIWRRSHKVRMGRDQILSIGRLIGFFRDRHYFKGCWFDIRARRFDPKGPWHGAHIHPRRRWKFAFQVPDGFHFDVKSEGGRPFSLCDAQGDIREYISYANVDCHGYVRGGK